MMEIYNSENFIKQGLVDEVFYPYNLSKKMKSFSLSDKEICCYIISEFCKSLYNHEPIKKSKYYPYFVKYLSKKSDGWFTLKGDLESGKFVNANKFFGPRIHCEENECHLCSYYFVLNSKIPTKLVFGLINPFNLKDGLFHSIGLFKRNGKEYVFDGANYLVMDKDLYYNLYNFTPLQVLDCKQIKNDKRRLDSPVLKKNIAYKLANIDLLYKRFYGFGFMAYLYNRKDFLANTDNQINNFKDVIKDYKQFEQKIKILKEKVYGQANKDSLINLDDKIR